MAEHKLDVVWEDIYLHKIETEEPGIETIVSNHILENCCKKYTGRISDKGKPYGFGYF